MSLEIYNETGFRFFPCHSDKSPDVPRGESWKNEIFHINEEKSETLQQTGQMIGAWIPEDIIIIDLDKHPGKPNGVIAFQELKEKLNMNIDFISDTSVVQTGGGGYHVFFYVGKNHTYRQGSLKIDGNEIGIDIKTDKGYIIASGSPGYKMLCESEPMDLPEQLGLWIEDIQNKKPSFEKKDYVDNDKKNISAKLLKSLLHKMPVENFRSNDRWLEFMMSSIAAAGRSAEIIGILEDWSNSDPQYSDHRNIANRIESVDEVGGITIGTFISLLREEGLSKYLVDQVVKIDTLTMAVLDGETSEGDLPFNEPDYKKLVELPQMKEFFTTQGNSAAKTILYHAMNGDVLHNKGEKETFFFNGSRWEVLNDLYSVVYTILFRCAKIFYSQQTEGKEIQDRMLKVIKSINDTTWKSKTITELNSMIREDIVDWDSPKIKETITTKDCVIDFRDGNIIKRSGYRSEFRLKYIDHSVDEILNSKSPNEYIDFMSSTFPDSETLKMAHELVSLCISGNTEKRIFQLWEGEGSNGKSTLIDIIKMVLKGKTNTYNPELLMPEKFNKGLSVTPELATFR